MKINTFLSNKKNNKSIILFSTILFCVLHINFVYAGEGHIYKNNVFHETGKILYAFNKYDNEMLPSDKVRVFVDKNKSVSNVIKKQDCSIMKNKIDSYGFGFKFGGLVYGMGPEVYFGNSSEIKWDTGAQIMIAEFMELCTRFNTGRLSQEEYSDEVNNIINRSRNYIIKLKQDLEKRKEILFKEIDEWNSPNF